MRFTISILTATLALPGVVLAHADHAGHEMPAAVTPTPFSAEHYLLAGALVAGVITARLVYRTLRGLAG